jgi:hypothetical protein
MTKKLKGWFFAAQDKLPGHALLLRAYYAIRYGGSKGVFTSKYERNAWGEEESISGSGSTLSYTESIRGAIPALIREYSITRFLDAPCGDYNWFRHIDKAPNFAYIGGDIVAPLVEKNNLLYGDSQTSFINLDITRDALPPADIWMCRDCLFHLSNRDIFRALSNLLRSGIPLLLTTTHFECEKNTDTATGGFRLLNLELEPFNLGPPVSEIDDWVDGHPKRKLALWRTDDIREHLSKNIRFRE